MLADTYYHVYNRANGSENLFRKPENYHYFIRQWQKYVSSVADSWAYCLMPNHFHFLIKVKSEDELKKYSAVKYKDNVTLSKGSKPLERVVSLQFSHFFNSYSQAYNKMYKRKGSLFIPNFKKKQIASDSYLATVVLYIHNNPVQHGFVKKIDEWPYNSYKVLLSKDKTFLNRTALHSWFGGKEKYLQYQQQGILGIDRIEGKLT